MAFPIKTKDDPVGKGPVREPQMSGSEHLGSEKRFLCLAGLIRCRDCRRPRMDLRCLATSSVIHLSTSCFVGRKGHGPTRRAPCMMLLRVTNILLVPVQGRSIASANPFSCIYCSVPPTNSFSQF